MTRAGIGSCRGLMGFRLPGLMDLLGVGLVVGLVVRASSMTRRRFVS